jgi:hypothetical protein
LSKAGRGNDGLWKAWKTKQPFPLFPQALEIKNRFSHYHHHDEYENEQVFHLGNWKYCLNNRDQLSLTWGRSSIATSSMPEMHLYPALLDFLAYYCPNPEEPQFGFNSRSLAEAYYKSLESART